MYVQGCSGGGVLTAWVVGHDDRFAAAASLCPVTNWISMVGTTDIPAWTFEWFEEPFLGTIHQSGLLAFTNHENWIR